jgi:two-component system NtrC family sensor kinase
MKKAFSINLKPKFWDHPDTGSDSRGNSFNFRRIWRLTIVITLGTALIPLMIMAFIDYRISRDAMLSEILLRTSRFTSNTRRNISAFLAERKAALDFVNHNDTFEYPLAKGRLKRVLSSLQKSFGGFVDLGIIDHRGIQLAYTGPYNLIGKDYSRAKWFQQVDTKGIYISDVFFGFRNLPHMVIAVKHARPHGRFYVLRATLDTASFNDLFAELAVGGEGDAFVINHRGILQTNSREHGAVLDKINLAVPKFSEHSEVEIIAASDGSQIVRGYAYIQDTPFILMIVKHQSELLALWNRSRTQIIIFLIISSGAILMVVFGGITFLVNQAYLADQHRLAAMHEAEYAHKMSSLGRLSAGVAHEINNPLAIINEKAGLIKDLFTFKKEYISDPKLMALIDSIMSSVTRCADITKRLLNFARRSNTCLQNIDLPCIIDEVLGFMGKEAEYRSIEIHKEIDRNLPRFKSDPGRLQEILLNLFTNAFAAMDDGGRLQISVAILDNKTDRQNIIIRVSDTGHGIPQADLKRVFEPFFSTRIGRGGTGLGLSITYGLVQELGGEITVESEVGKGATFKIVLPLALTKIATDARKAKTDECMERIP